MLRGFARFQHNASVLLPKEVYGYRHRMLTRGFTGGSNKSSKKQGMNVLMVGTHPPSTDRGAGRPRLNSEPEVAEDHGNFHR